MFSKNVLHYGEDLTLPERVPLRAGPLRLFFENGDLRHICYQDREIIRRVYTAVRDRNWGTVTPQLSNLQINKTECEFGITFDIRCQQREIDFRWQGEVLGGADGEITFSMVGESCSEFWRNRIGFCVLHPIDEYVGKPCEIEHTDGCWQQGQFPRFISPHQPFKDIRAIRYEVVSGIYAEVYMTGDTFEMEDQRNWTDASFKTYCTPLSIPFPVRVKEGDRVTQMVRLLLKGILEGKFESNKAGQPVNVSLVTDKEFPIPSIGLGLASHGQALRQLEINRLKKLNLNHLRVDLWMEEEAWRNELLRAVDSARLLDCRLEIALHLTEAAESELLMLLPALNEISPKVARWIIFHVDEISPDFSWVELCRNKLQHCDLSADFGCGADSNFTELNRWFASHYLDNRTDPNPDFLSYAANPQVHAFDNLSLAENLAGLGETLVSARRLANGMPIVVSPVTLKPRGNNPPGSYKNETLQENLPETVDPRQMSLFGAGWTLGAVKYLAENGANHLTFFETTGWRGLMETGHGSRLPDVFQSIPGAVFPMYHIFAYIGEFMGGQVILTKSSDPLRIVSLALRKGGQTSVILANIDSRSSQIYLMNLPDQVRIKTLDEMNAVESMESPERFQQQPEIVIPTEDGLLNYEIKPYAIIRIAITGE